MEVFKMKKLLVLQSDFGLCDGAVSAMYGVSLRVDPTLQIHDLTHEIPQFNVWDGSYRLFQTVPYWPQSTVFVSVVDPGVGSERLSVVAKTTSGHYIVTPDNGTLTHIYENIGIEEVRIIDEAVHRLPNSEQSHTFHGRDVYAYTGARLAAGQIEFKDIGREWSVKDLLRLIQPQASYSGDIVKGSIDILDVRFGNLWTNVSESIFQEQNIKYGDILEVSIAYHNKVVYKQNITYGKSFASIDLEEPLIYINSVGTVGIALNQGSFAEKNNIGTGINWRIRLRKVNKTKLRRAAVINYVESHV